MKMPHAVSTMPDGSDLNAPGPFHPKSLVIEAELTSPTSYLRFSPERYETGAWVHDPKEFDHSLDRESAIARYALPEAGEHEVAIVAVPAGESIQIGSAAAETGEYGRGDLIRIEDRDGVPEAWIQETTTLQTYLEETPSEGGTGTSESGGILETILGLFSGGS